MFLAQWEIDELVAMPKKIIKPNPRINLPDPGEYSRLDLVAVTDKTKMFMVDVNRKNKTIIIPYRYTYQKRYTIDINLLRLDIEAGKHSNPDGTIAPNNHLHIWKEGFRDRWAYPLPNIFSNPSDLYITLKEFLQYSNVENLSDFTFSLQGRVF